jgi:ABC-type transporter Mla subunit MlaD
MFCKIRQETVRALVVLVAGAVFLALGLLVVAGLLLPSIGRRPED